MTTPARCEARGQSQQAQIQLAPDQIDKLLCQERVTIQLPLSRFPIQQNNKDEPVTIPGSQWTVTSTSSPTKPSSASRRKSQLKPRQELEVEPSSKLEYPDAPERPPKPFQHYFRSVMATLETEQDIDKQGCLDNCRADWKVMETEDKGALIQQALDEYNKYEYLISVYMRDNPSYVPPPRKKFLTEEERKILDKSKGRPEKPPSSAYSLFTKHIMNDPEDDIKKYPPKDQMKQIAMRFKMLDERRKELYQAEVNGSMAKYATEYKNWFDNLSEKEKAVERERGNKYSKHRYNKKFSPP